MSYANTILAFCLTTLAACGEQSSAMTLYRNSPVDHSMRIHWSSFDAKVDGSYNMNNCMMGAKLLNANVTAIAKADGKERDPSIGFWCEPGGYKEKGMVPASFEEAFPAAVYSR
ncbi:hypothetical protein [Sphingosinicella sp.]|uniref:hypothetical protein n=1 Tax=Sphingosinicella sp. TaxID=1917971 RepID=UPI0017ECED63|nr:hypothetical protein [Sphingosinicella sp.]MBA4757731.1 hypothetical protein [Sphingosinicella sp.]